MAKEKANRWIVLKGRPVFACTTRRQARKYIKKNKERYPEYNYVGKVIDKKRKIILDI